jgi:hypothetical protein
MNFSIRGVVPRCVLSLFVVLLAVPQQANACACGCGMFDVSTGGVLPDGPGGTVWLEHDYMNQDHNHQDSSSASDTLNDDKKIRTGFTQLGGQYMLNRDWGVKAQVPYVDRNFVTTDDDTGDIVSRQHGGIGDIRLTGIYSGLLPDMSAGLTFGVKLPTGDYTHEGFDRDTSIGTGSTDILLGAYKMGRFSDPANGWFVNGVIDQPVSTQDSYRPGTEINATVGAYHEGWALGKVQITPMMQVIGSQRMRDSGAEADWDGSGYTRFLASPGIEFKVGNTKLYTDIAVPFYEHVNGDQLVASETFKVVLSQDF